jgi:hypothetical protein
MYISWNLKAKQVLKKKKMEEFLKVNQTTTTGQIILNHK